MLKIVRVIDLQHWADSKDSEHLMPELMRRLIHASIREITRISFPNEDCVDLPGFDGLLETTFKNPYVPVGKSVFELGRIKSKKRKRIMTIIIEREKYLMKKKQILISCL